MQKTAGKWQGGSRAHFIAMKPTEQQSFMQADIAGDNVYFIASNVERMLHGAPAHDYLLVAINELPGEREVNHLKAWIAAGKHVLIDSGVFWLTNRHKEAHNMTMDEALALPPDEIDGFDDLLERYLEINYLYGEDSWGYIEIDQGGRDNKIKTREMLEGKGLRPIPVYHPFNDGWDYFDYLAERYDRICFGNVVQANRETRLKLVATAWERKRKYPHLWIHLLGLTPNEWLNAFPIDSADSSSWLAAVRWTGGYRPKSDGATIGNLHKNYFYKLKSDINSEHGSRKATRMSAYGANMQQRNWQAHLAAWEDIGMELLP